MDSNSDWIKYGAGTVYMKKGHFKVAEEIFRDILAINPSYGNAYAQLGLIRKNEGKKDEGIIFLEKALRVDPDNELANYQLGILHMECGNYDSAADYFSRILKLNPFFMDAMVNLAIVFGRKGDFDKAEKLTIDFYCKDKMQKDGFARLGWLKAEAQDWPGAVALMNKDCESGRLSPPWQVHLAQAYGRTGDFVKAVELIDHAYKRSESIKDGYAMLGWIKAEVQDPYGALGLMSKDLEKKRISPEWLSNLAFIKVFTGEFGDAVKLIDDLYAKNEAITDGYAKIGWACYLLSEDNQSLHSLIEKDTRLNRLAVDGKRVKAIAMSLRGDIVPASVLMDSIYAENTIIKDGFAMMGWHRIEKGDLKTGLELMEKDCRLQRMSPIWRINYAYQLAKAGQCQKARLLFEEVMEVEPRRKVFQIGYQVCPISTFSKLQFQQMIGVSV